jgi:hypothetical protein
LIQRETQIELFSSFFQKKTGTPHLPPLQKKSINVFTDSIITIACSLSIIIMSDANVGKWE